MSRRRLCDKRKRDLCANSDKCDGSWWERKTCKGFAPSAVDACYKCVNYVEYNTATPGEYIGRCFIPTDDVLVDAMFDASWDGETCVFYEIAPEFDVKARGAK